MFTPRPLHLCLALLAACGEDPAGGSSEPGALARGDLGPEERAPQGPQVHPEDPQGWVPTDEFEGAPIEVLRDAFPGGRLRRIGCYHAGRAGEPDGRHGPEWSYFKNGFLKETLYYRDGVATGPFQRAYTNGQTWTAGEFVEGKRHGGFQQWFENGDLQMAFEYDRGQPTGFWREWYVGLAPKVEAHYVDGVKSGERRAWDKPRVDENGQAPPEGVLTLVEHYERDLRHGAWTDYDPQVGTVRTEGRYEHGVRVGVWTVTFPTGQVLDRFQYVDGVLHGPQVRRTPEGELLEELTWEHGSKDGPTRQFYGAGGLQAEGDLRAGLRHGPWTYYKPDGSIDETWSGLYENDERVDDLPDLSDQPDRR